MQKRFFKSNRCSDKKHRFNESGQITIFLCVLLPAMIFLFGVLVDIVIVSCGVNQAKRTAVVALDSVLTNYSTVIKDEFKVFCINGNNDNAIEENIEDQFIKNYDDKSIINMNITNVEVRMLDSLDNPEVLREQIVGYMRYNLPIDIIEKVYSKIQPFFDNTNTFTALDKKLEVDNQLGDLDGLCERLYGYLFSGEKIYPVNKFNNNEEFNKMILEYFDEETTEKKEKFIEIVEYIKGHINSSNYAIYLLKQIDNIMIQVKSKMDELENYAVEKLSSTSMLAGELADVLLSEFSWYAENLVKEKTQNEINELNSNIILLNKMIEELNSETSEKLIEYINEYSYIDFSLNFKKTGEQGNDVRNHMKNLVLNMLDCSNEDICIPYSYDLPSSSIETDNIFSLITNSLNNGVSFSKSKEAQDLFKAITWDAASKCIDDLLINEYIIRYLSNTTDGGVSQRKCFFRGEAEYVIFGNYSSNANYNSTKASILAVRFGMNTLSAYLDPKKRTLAYGTATAIVGWWSWGCAIPVASNLIMCGWGLAESVLDVKAIVSGKKVPLYKLPSDWKLDIGLNKNANNLTSLVSIGYEDYLRLFLLTVPEKNKVARIADIIQLAKDDGSEEFKISECYSTVETEISITIQCKLFGKLFFEDGKYNYTFTTKRGYE